MFISGLKSDAVNMKSEHVVVSKDNKFALWAGIIDDLWKLGKPVGSGNILLNQPVKKDVPTDQYLMTGFDKKSISIKSDTAVRFAIEVDIDGTDLWVDYDTISVEAGKEFVKDFGDDFKGYWFRLRPLNDANNLTVCVYYK